MDCHRTSSEDLGAQGRDGDPRDQGSQDRLADVGVEVEQSLQEEGRLTDLQPRRASNPSGPQPDDPTVAEASHGEDLPDQSSGCLGPSRVRTTQCVDLRRDPEPPGEVRRRGDGHSSRRSMFQQAAKVGNLVGATKEWTDRKEDYDSSGRQGPCQRKDQRKEDRGEECTLSGQQFRDCHHVGGHAANDEPDGRDEGGHRQPSWPSPQEGSQRRGHGEQRDMEPGDTTEPGTVIYGDGGDPMNGGDPSDETQLQVGKDLTPEARTFFEHINQDIAANVFESVVHDQDVILVEVACSPESRLPQEVQRSTGRENAAVRCSHWNGCDLGTGDGVKLTISRINTSRPRHVYISPECGPYSPIQNMNQKTEEQRKQLEEKRRLVLKQYVGACCVYRHCVQQGIHVTWEWSEKCQGWRLPLLQKLQEDFGLYAAVVHGCQVNLRNPQNQRLLKKGWKLMTTHKRVADMMHMPCKCGRNYQHALCEGNMTRQTAYYTKEFVKRFVAAIKHEMGRKHLVAEMNGETQLPRHFGEGPSCYCKEVHQHGIKLTCGSCQHDLVQGYMTNEEQPYIGVGDTQTTNTGQSQRHELDVHEGSKGNHLTDDVLKWQLYLLHAATGHCSTRNMVLALQKRGAGPRVLEAARKFKCSVCEEKKRINHKHVASLEPLPPKWATVCADGGTWTHSETNETVGFAVLIDEGCRFRTARILSRGKKQTMSASQFLNYFREGWAQYFGNPQCLRLDPAGAFRSNEVEAYCDQYGIYLDVVPAEAHWKFGICEQAVRGLKEVMNKLVTEEPAITPEEAISTAVRTFNHREIVRGFSPVQHAMGLAPDETGRFVSSLEGRQHEAIIANPTEEFQQTIERMKIAEQAHSSWNARERITRAMNSRGQRQNHYQPGDLVYYWRKQLPKSMNATKTGGFLGPGRVLVTETKREADGQLRPGSTVWIVRGRRLLKCSVEQLRPATHREHLLEHIAVDENKTAPWTIPRMVEGLGKHEYEDVTNETPTLQEWQRGQSEEVQPMEVDDEPMEPVQRAPHNRHRQKRPVEPPGDKGEDKRGRGQQLGSSSSTGLEAEAWWTSIDFPEPEAEAIAYWEDAEAAIEVAIDMPTTNRRGVCGLWKLKWRATLCQL